jgi:type IV pilus assembly protein PilO
MASLIPQDPKQQRYLVAIVLGIAAAGLFWNFWATPREEEIVVAEERVEALEGQNQQARIQAARGEAGLEETLATFERHVRRLEQLVPAGQELPQLITDIAMEAQRLGLESQMLVPGPEEPGVSYNRRTYEMGWVGEYHAVGEFLASIASLSRIITPINLSVQPWQGTPYPQFEAPVEAVFTIETYVLPTQSGLGTQMNVEGVGG